MHRVLIVHPDADVVRAVEVALREKANRPLVIESAPSIADGLRRARDIAPQMVFLDVGVDRALVLRAVNELRSPGRLIVGLYNPLVVRADWAFIREFTRAGVGDFIQVPPSDEEVAAVMATAELKEQRAPVEGEVVAFFSHQGGVGTTTLAVHTAALLASQSQFAKNLAICDANMQFGTVAPCLGLSPLRDVSAFVQDSQGGAALAACLTEDQTYGISVLAAPRDPIEGAAIGPEDLTRVIIELRRRFRYVVVDTAPVLDLLAMSVLDSADRIMVVTDAVTPTVLGAAMLVNILEEEGLGGDRLRVILNRFSSFDGNLSERTVRERLGRPVNHVVPYDRNFVVAATRGRPLIGGRVANAVQVALASIAEDAFTRQPVPLS